MNLKNGVLLLLVIALTASLPLLGIWASGVEWNENWNPLINRQIIYQSITLGITIVFLFVLRFSRKGVFLAHFQKGNIRAPFNPVPQLGIKASKPGENWFHLGRNFAIVITAVTVLVIFMQIVREGETNWMNVLRYFPLILLFSLVNSFVEESITRLGVIVALKEKIKDNHIALISGAIFGIVHFWGYPGGFVGLLVAGFLGWLLAKSILETKGIFWAWFIHFLQDVVIISAFFLSQNNI